MGRWAGATALACGLVLVGCSVGGSGEAEAGPAGFDIAEVRRRVEGPGVRCTDPDRDPSTVAPLPKPAAVVGCDTEDALLVISEYREGRDVVKLHQVGCEMGMGGYRHLAAGRWTVEIEDDYGEDLDPDEVLGPLADRLGVRVVGLDC